ncbi:MAG TPA: TonB-dependent receptor [Steroidobacteraceae bacterium]|nr:TonB-dependent receptor [Steroidobacteraceae bacterium]
MIHQGSSYVVPDWRRLWLCAGAVFGLLAAPVVSVGASGDSPKASPTATEAGGLEEIIVTAQRRGENLQSVPLSVTAITAEAAERLGVTDMTSLTAAVPGLDFSRQANAATPFIRGVGATSSLIGNEASVATYVDGVYISAPQGALFSLSNIERIEVLKGPQGTLFGRNATGGVVHVITRDPSQDTHVDAQAGYGNYRTSTESLYATTGITRDLAADVSLYGLNQSKGWGANVTTHEDAFKAKDFAARTKWLWKPGEDTRVMLSADFSVSQGEQGIGLSPLPGTRGLDGATSSSGFYNTAVSPNDYYKTTQYGGSLRIEHDFGWARLSSITASRRYRSPFGLDQDATPLPLIEANIQGRDRSLSEELQLLSTTNSPIQWIGGLYYLKDTSSYQPLGLSGLALQGLPYSDIFSTQKLNSYSGFGQTTIEVVDATHLTLGVRYTSDHRSITGQTTVPLGPGGSPVAILPGGQSAVFSKPTWRIAFDHQFMPDLLAYVSYNRGFKSGVFDSLAYSNAAVKPEVLDAYEIGVKSEFLDRRLRVNAAIFDYKYQDIQVDQLTGGVSTLLNAAKAKIYGADLDVILVPVAGLTIGSAFEFLHGRYDSFPNAPLYTPVPTGGDATGSFDAAGKTAVRSPDFTGNLTVAYAYAASFGKLDFVAGDYYNSGFYWNPDDRVKQPSYSLVNASVTWAALPGNWDARFWGKNLLSKRYYSYATDQAFGDDASPAAPLTYGITVGYHFR